jgi:hypothetical protein
MEQETPEKIVQNRNDVTAKLGFLPADPRVFYVTVFQDRNVEDFPGL